MPITFQGVSYLRVHELPEGFVRKAPLTTGIIIELRRGMHVGCAMCQIPLSKDDNSACAIQGLTASEVSEVCQSDDGHRCSEGFIYLREDDAEHHERYNVAKVIWMASGYKTRAEPDVCAVLDTV